MKQLLFFTLCLFAAISLMAQKDSIPAIHYGTELPGYKMYNFRYLVGPENNVNNIPVSIRDSVGRQLNAYTNGLARRHFSLKSWYNTRPGSFVVDRNNTVVNENGQVLSVKYRLIYEIKLPKSPLFIFGLNIDSTGRILYPNEIPLALESKPPRLLNSAGILKHLHNASRSFGAADDMYLYYNPLTLRMEWQVQETSEKEPRKIAVLNAITGELISLEEQSQVPLHEVQVSQ